MKKLLVLVISAMAMMISCKNAGQTAAANGTDSLQAVIDSIIEENDTTPMPMFLMGSDGKYMQMLYWIDIEEPMTEDELDDKWYAVSHQSWAVQEMFRRNAAQYTNLLTEDGMVKVKFIDEVLKDPDGNTPSIGEIHGREGIPSLCARFSYADAKDDKEENSGCIIVTDSYLKSRKRLDIDYDQSEWDDPKALPEAVVKQLEKKYGMKVERMRLIATIGKDYIWGLLQFKGAYKNAPKDKYDPDRQSALALDVLIKGDEIWVNEELGYYNEEYGATWNADDDGEYVGCHIMEAFEGPKGLELCYLRSAPESSAVGIFYQRDNQLIRHNYETYHNMVDEEIPVWKTDLATMDKMYHADERSDKDVKLTKWSHCNIDYDNEWIWLRDQVEKNGAFFTRKDGKFTLVAIETPNLRPSESEQGDIHYLKLAGHAGGPSWQQEIHAFKNGQRIWKLNVLEVEGEIYSCTLNGKDISKEEGKSYLDKIPQGTEINAYFQEF